MHDSNQGDALLKMQKCFEIMWNIFEKYRISIGLCKQVFINLPIAFLERSWKSLIKKLTITFTLLTLVRSENKSLAAINNNISKNNF